MNLTIIIPAFNEGQHIADVLRSLQGTLSARNLSASIIVIDDGSKDDTSSQGSSVPNIKVIRHSRNKGYGASLKTGIRAATTEWVMTYDADGQHTGENIDALLPLMNADHDLVIGKREGFKGPWIRQPGKRLIGAVANYITETKIPDFNSGLRAFRRSSVLPYLHLFPNGFSFSTTSTVCFLKEGLNVGWAPITIRKSLTKSTVRPRDAVKTLMLIIRLSMLFSPLRIFLPASVLFGILTVGLIGYELAAHRNFSDAGVALLSFTALLFFFGLLADQIAALRREQGNALPTRE